jgi:hypothetical protein
MAMRLAARQWTPARRSRDVPIETVTRLLSLHARSYAEFMDHAPLQRSGFWLEPKC